MPFLVKTSAPQLVCTSIKCLPESEKCLIDLRSFSMAFSMTFFLNETTISIFSFQLLFSISDWLNGVWDISLQTI